jgi:hypothetical protein
MSIQETTAVKLPIFAIREGSTDFTVIDTPGTRLFDGDGRELVPQSRPEGEHPLRALVRLMDQTPDADVLAAGYPSVENFHDRMQALLDASDAELAQKIYDSYTTDPPEDGGPQGCSFWKRLAGIC